MCGVFLIVNIDDDEEDKDKCQYIRIVVLKQTITISRFYQTHVYTWGWRISDAKRCTTNGCIDATIQVHYMPVYN